MFGRGVVLVLCALVARPALAEAPEIEIARGHSRRGAEHYAAARFREAAAEFELARNELPLPELDFNLGRCYEGTGDVDAAIAAYRRYLGSSPKPSEREDVERRVRLLEIASPRVHERLDRERRTSVAQRRWRTLMPAAITVGVLALASGAAAGGLYAGAVAERDRLDQPCPPSCSGDYDRLKTLNTAALATFGIAVAAAGVDLVLWGVAGSARKAMR